MWVFVLLWTHLGTNSSCVAQFDARSNQSAVINHQFIIPYIRSFGQGTETQLDVGPDGTVHIVYVDKLNGNLMYIHNHTGEWEDPVVIAEHRYGVQTPDIAVDSQGKIHIAVTFDGAGARYVTNAGGTWEVHTISSNALESFFPKVAVDVDQIAHFVFHPSSDVNGGSITYVNSSFLPQRYPLSTNFDLTLFEERSDIVVDSSGGIHVVFKGVWNNTAVGPNAVGDIFYTTVDPTNTDQSFSDPVRISNAPAMGYADWPVVEVGPDDSIHTCFNIHEPNVGSKIIYMPLGSQVTPADGTVVSTTSLTTGFPHMVVGSPGFVDVAFQGSAQVPSINYYNTDIYYATNRGGVWEERRVTNTPLNTHWVDIAVVPSTNQALLVYTARQTLGEQYQTYLLEQQDSLFGSYVDTSAQLTSGALTLEEEEPYDIEVVVSNPLDQSQEFDLTLSLNDNNGVRKVGGNAVSLQSLAVGEEQTYTWTFEVAGVQNTYVTVNLTSGDYLVGSLSFLVENSGFPTPSFGLTTLISVLTIAVSLKKMKRKPSY